MSISNEIITNVISNVFTITLCLLAIYPVKFILLTMVNLIVTWFGSVNLQTKTKVERGNPL